MTSIISEFVINWLFFLFFVLDSFMNLIFFSFSLHFNICWYLRFGLQCFDFWFWFLAFLSNFNFFYFILISIILIFLKKSVIILLIFIFVFWIHLLIWIFSSFSLHFKILIYSQLFFFIKWGLHSLNCYFFILQLFFISSFDISFIRI
jgi:hypothetical protein